MLNGRNRRASSDWLSLCGGRSSVVPRQSSHSRIERVHGGDEIGAADAIDAPLVEDVANVGERNDGGILIEHVSVKGDGGGARDLVVANTVSAVLEVVGNGEQDAPIIGGAVVQLGWHLGVGIELAIGGPALDQATHLRKGWVEFVEPLQRRTARWMALHINDHGAVHQRQRQRADGGGRERGEDACTCAVGR